MSVIVDTSAWSRFLRRDAEVHDLVATEVERLIRSKAARLLGVVRQELLSGIRSEEQFEAVRRQLNWFPDLVTTMEDHVLAASFSNRCRRLGVQGSLVDYLICAIAVREAMPIFTTDRDFELFEQHVPITLHSF